MILSLFYYPALYYPLLACGTLHNQVGYVLGSLLSWTHFGVLVWQKVDCPKTPEVRGKNAVCCTLHAGILSASYVHLWQLASIYCLLHCFNLYKVGASRMQNVP